MGMEAPLRKPYPSDVSDDEWAFIAPYLTLMTEDAPQRHHELRELFNGLRYVVKTGAPWRWMPNDLPALGSGLPAEPALAAGRLLRGDRARPARSAAAGGRAAARADGGDLRRSHTAEHTRERGARRLRRPQEKERRQ